MPSYLSNGMLKIAEDGSILCECNVCIDGNCNEIPNCDPKEFEDIDYFDDDACGYGPWDTFIKDAEDNWVYDDTLFCLTSVYPKYQKEVNKLKGEYRVVLSGNSYDWDPSEDPTTPECWYEIDPYSPPPE